MDRSRRASFFRPALSSALAGAFLNLAAGLLAHPRALATWAGLGPPLAAGFLALLAAAVPVAAILAGIRARWGRAADAGVWTGFVLTSALAPMVEVALREASSQRAAVVLGCAAGFVVCAGAWVQSMRARGRLERLAAHGGTCWVLAGGALLAAVWCIEYRASGSATRVAAGLAGLATALAALRFAPRLERPVVAPLVAALLLVHGLVAFPRDPARTQGTVRTDPARPPVVLITVDTLRADRVLGAGPARVATPTLDRLAADSVVFTQARSAAPWTKPSLATLLTGLSPAVHGMTNRRARLPEGIETLAERLRAAGYHTGGVGLNVHLERAFRFDQGFDDYAFPARPEYGIALGAKALERLAPARFPEVYPSTTAIADAAVGWIGAHADEPFFLWVHVLDPHWPYEPPAEWVEHPERAPRRWGEPEMVTNVQAGNTKPGLAERERVAELYAGEIRYVDDQLARIVALLEERGLYDPALIVVASDHGEEFWEHGRYEHGHTLYDEVLRVPLLFKLPGAAVRAQVPAAVSTEALLPTVLETLGLPYDPELLSARSLVPWWQAPETAREEPLFACGTYYFGEKRGVVFGGHKLVLDLDTGRGELYDLRQDPLERHSLTAADPVETGEGLRLLGEWQERCARLRERLAIESDTSAEANAELLERMRGLGYAGTD